VALAESDDARRRHALRATLAGCDRAAHLVDQLLTLSRLEGGAGVRFETVDLSRLARQVVGELAPRALNRQQDLAAEAAGPCTIDGDATLLAVLLRNLIDNALRYSPPGARIHVSADEDPATGRVRVHVQDSGPGLDDEAMQRLGERFLRDQGQAASGSGLGWSIVRRIAEVHGIKVNVDRSQALGGLSVTLSAARRRASPSPPAARSGF
jgi:two-component system sensor histidine kinase QseC